jgi:hypothetical protein
MLENEFKRLFWVAVGFMIGYIGAMLLLSESPSPEPPERKIAELKIDRGYSAQAS